MAPVLVSKLIRPLNTRASSYPFLIASSGFFLVPAICALHCGQVVNAFLLIATSFASAKYWSDPIFEPVAPLHIQLFSFAFGKPVSESYESYESVDSRHFYKALDLSLSKVVFVYMFFQSLNKCKSAENIVSYSMVVVSTIATYLASCHRFKYGDPMWQLYHFAFHCQVVYLQGIVVALGIK